MGLIAYQQRVQLLLNDVRQQIFNIADITTYINLARTQVAGEAECCRSIGLLSVDSTAIAYPFSAIVLDDPAFVRAINVRSAAYLLDPTGDTYPAFTVHTRPFEWFQYFELSNPAPVAGPPKVWAQFKQAFDGSLYVNKLDGPYTMRLDTVCIPINLVDDSTADGIPILYRSSVSYYAAYLAFLGNNEHEASKELHNEYARNLEFGRRASNPSQLPGLYLQSKDPTIANKLGVSPPRGG